MLSMFLISTVSASMNYQKKTYTFDSLLPTWLGGSGKSTVELISNTDQCLLNCEATIKFTNEKPIVLTNKIDLKNIFKKNVKNNVDLELLLGKYQEVEKNRPIYSEICEQNKNSTNGTKETCYQKQTSEETYTETQLVWTEYKGTKESGEVFLKIKGTKTALQNIDWIITFRKQQLDKWAWWNSSWNYKKQVNFTADNGNFTTFTVPYDSDMQTDFDDLRFVNSAEDTELNYTIRSKVDSTSALITVNSLGESSIYMYYGNAGVSTTSNAQDTYLNASALFYLDEGSGVVVNSGVGADGTNNGAVRDTDGWVNDSFDLEGGVDGDYISFGDSWSSYKSFSLWFDPDVVDYTGDLVALYADDDTGANDFDITVFIDHDASCDSGKIAYYSSHGWDCGSTLTTNTLYNLIGVANGTEWSFYLNGSLDAHYAHTLDFGGSYSGYDLEIGRYQTGNDQFNGIVDEYYTWNRALSSDEIQQIFTNSEPTVTFGSEELPNLPPVITINTPHNTTYYYPYSTGISVNYYDPDNDQYTCSVYEDGNLRYQHTYTAAAGWSGSLTQQLSGLHAVWVNCTDDVHATTSSEIVYYTLVAEYVGVSYFENNIYEKGVYTNATIICGYCSDETEIQAWLDINGSRYNMTNTSTGYAWKFEYNGTAILNANATNDTTVLHWDTYYSGAWHNNTENHNQTLYQSYWAEANFTDQSNYNEGDNINYFVKLYNDTTLLNLTLTSQFNNTEYPMSYYNSSSNTIHYTSSYTAPYLSTSQNFSINSTAIISNGVYNRSISIDQLNTTIYNLEIDNCTTGTVELYNLTVVDEETQVILPNASVVIAINVYDSTRSLLLINYSKLFQKINPITICMNTNVSDGTTYSLDAIIRYRDAGNANEYYNLVNQPLTNETTSQKIILYDLNLSDSTEFQLTFTGSDFLPIENALVYVNRQYISENKFKTVELPKTDYNGQTILHMVRNDIIYNIKIIKDGEVLGNFENIVAFCDDYTIGNCKIELRKCIRL